MKQRETGKWSAWIGYSYADNISVPFTDLPCAITEAWIEAKEQEK